MITGVRNEDVSFLLWQLEVLWQAGAVNCVYVPSTMPDSVRDKLLPWLERRHLATIWRPSSMSELRWLQEHVLQRYTFPVAVAPGPDARESETGPAASEMLNHHTQLFLIAHQDWAGSQTARALQRHPGRVVPGLTVPGRESLASPLSVFELGLWRNDGKGSLSENLRSMMDRAARVRNEAMRERADLLFPPLPSNRRELDVQGFRIVAPEEFSREEFDDAKSFWSDYGVKQWYSEYKPWARWLAALVQELKPRAVLEFGCNVGRNLAYMAEAAPGIRYVGVDVNAEAIRLGRDHTGLDLRHGDERTIQEFRAGEFDLVFTVSVLDHISDIAAVCRSLVRCSARDVFCLEVSLPVEGKVIEHFDHKHGCVRPSTGASYSWHVDKYLWRCPRVRRVKSRPCYLHNASLGPYYRSYLASLKKPEKA